MLVTRSLISRACALVGCLVLGSCARSPAVIPFDAAPVPADRPAVDAPPKPDRPAFDWPQLEAYVPDARLIDIYVPHLPCQVHCDCPQGFFCAKGLCQLDAKLAVYCCTKSDCPPGRPCFGPANAKATCPESTSYSCASACDCGPAHCCVDNRCVKDSADPWLPGPGVGTGPAGKCVEGVDATYCCDDPACYAGQEAFANTKLVFRCGQRDNGALQGFCRAASCFGTACNCAAGESCVDTTASKPVAGKTCHRLSGGSCVSNLAAQVIFGLAASELLPCCSPYCVPGQLCDAGWRSDSQYSFARVTATCGKCGDGKCGPGETAASCPWDCAPTCGDGKCASGESVTSCAADCGKCGDGICRPGEEASCPADCCGNGTCDPGESASSCAADCGKPSMCAPALGAQTWSKYTVCGDGVCQGGKTCDWNEAESCRTCPQDCGPCEWQAINGRAAGEPGFVPWTIQPFVSDLRGVWGSSSSDVFAGGTGGRLLHYDGTSWKAMASGVTDTLNSIWGNSSSDVVISAGFARDDCGYGTPDNGKLLRYDGTSWKTVLSSPFLGFDSVWGSSSSDILAVGNCPGIWHWDGTSWNKMATKQGAQAVWGSSSSNVFAATRETFLWGGWPAGIVHYDGKSWSLQLELSSIYGLWGSSASDIFAVGAQAGSSSYPLILHYDGSSWKSMNAGGGWALDGVWGSSPSSVFAVGRYGTILHYDGKAWSTARADLRQPPYGSSCPDLGGIGGAGAGNGFIVGARELILRYCPNGVCSGP